MLTFNFLEIRFHSNITKTVNILTFKIKNQDCPVMPVILQALRFFFVFWGNQNFINPVFSLRPFTFR